MAVDLIPTASPEAEQLFESCGLTNRECLAARSVLAGMTAETASHIMGVSPSTVGSLRGRAYRKLNVAGSGELIERFGRPAPPAPARDETRKRLLARGLSRTQADVLSLVAEGLSSGEVAEELRIAPGTVSSARANGYRLLGVHSCEELVALLDSDEKDDDSAPRRRGRRFFKVALIVGLVVLLSTVVAAGWAFVPEGGHTLSQGQDEPDPAGLTAISHTHGIVDLDDIVASYREGGAANVMVTREGDVDDEHCLIVSSLSDGDPRMPDSLYENATVHLVVTSDTEVPSVYDTTPIDATNALREAGLVADPSYRSFSGTEGKPMINQPRVTSMSESPGKTVRVGTVVKLGFNASVEGYS